MNARTTLGHAPHPTTATADPIPVSLACPTCDDLICLDCAAGVGHERCTRPCPDCADQPTDWDACWEASAIVTELAGLHRLDEALREG